jgi:hypothetical protein
VSEEVGALLRPEGVQGGEHELLQPLGGALLGLAEQGLELAAGVLDRVQVRAVRRQVDQGAARRLDQLTHLRALVRGQVVHHHHVARRKLRQQHPLDVGHEQVPVHRPVDGHRRTQPVLAQGADERRRVDQALAHRAAAASPGHVGRGRRLVDEHQPGGVDQRLGGPELLARLLDAGAVLLGGAGDFF